MAAIATAMRGLWRDVWSLLAAFGLAGLAIWPLTAWLGYDLIEREVAALEGLHVNSSTLVGRDFVNIWHGGAEARENGASAVYNLEVYRQSLEKNAGARGGYAFSYPPHMLTLAMPFGLVSYPSALLIWSLAGGAFFWLAAKPWLRQVGLPGWAVLLLPASVVNLWAGHFGFFVGGLMLFGYWLAERKPTASGLAFAVMTVKPHLGLFVPVVLLLRKRWHVIAFGAAFFAALIALSLATLGIDAWQHWLGTTLAHQFSLATDVSASEFKLMMPTVQRSVMQITSSATLPSLVQWGTMLFVGLALLWLARREIVLTDLALVAIVGTFLALPYVFHYDMPIVSLVALIAAKRWQTRWYRPDGLICGAAFLVPLVQVPLAKLGYWFSPVAIGLLFGLVMWRVVNERAG